MINWVLIIIHSGIILVILKCNMEHRSLVVATFPNWLFFEIPHVLSFCIFWPQQWIPFPLSEQGTPIIQESGVCQAFAYVTNEYACTACFDVMIYFYTQNLL